MSDLDPAAIMAEHDNAPLYCPICPHHYGVAHCLPWLLADALVKAEEREQRVRLQLARVERLKQTWTRSSMARLHGWPVPQMLGDLSEALDGPQGGDT